MLPAEFLKARNALAVAERSFQQDPKSFRTRDLAYVANRKARVVEALASTNPAVSVSTDVDKDYLLGLVTEETAIARGLAAKGDKEESESMLSRARADGELATALSRGTVDTTETTQLIEHDRSGKITNSLKEGSNP